MRKIISTLFLLSAFVLGAQGQIVITEISYNQPGTDIVEYVELYNNSANTVDLSGWSFTQGFVYTFPSGVNIGPNGYLLIAGDSVAMNDVFGLPARQWTSGGLSNSGEDITIVDAMGATIDSVDFEDNSGGWPEVCDGNGPALVLCDVNSDNNDVANWTFSSLPTAARIDNDSSRLFGSPLAPNAGATCSAAPAYFFNGTYAEVGEGAGTVDVSFIVAHTGPMDSVEIVLTVNGANSTATGGGADYTYTTVTTPVSPDGVGGRTFVDIPITINDDMDQEGDEFIVFNLGAAIVNGVTPRFMNSGDFVVKIIDNDVALPPLPRYDIGLITADADNNGEADSVGIRCEVQGIVHGIDLQGGSSVQFTIIDSTGGMGVFSNDDFGYTVNEGDEVIVRGPVGSFRGLGQMGDNGMLDSIVFVSSGNPIVTPLVVTTLDESTESEIVSLECVAMIDTSDWPTSGGSVNIDFTNGVDTFAVRIDSDVDLNGTPVPASKWLNVSGIGGQFSFNPSDLDGYQLLPRYQADVVELGNPAVSFVNTTDTVMEDAGTIMIDLDIMNGNPDTTSVTVSLAAASSTATDMTDFTYSETTLDFSGCGNDAGMISLDITDDMDVEMDETIVLVISSITNNAEAVQDTVRIVVMDNDNASVRDLIAKDAIRFRPNPATSTLFVEASLAMDQLEVLDLVGKQVMSVSNPARTTQLNVADLPQGTYLLRAITDQGVWVSKWVKQ